MASRREFEHLVHQGFLRIPDRFRQKIRNVAILIEDEPDDDVRQKQGLSDGETLLGLYQGIPATERGSEYGVGPTLPDTITIFQKPIEELSGGDPEAIEQIVAETVMHEYAHYFGMSEQEVEEWEKKAKGKRQNSK